MTGERNLGDNMTTIALGIRVGQREAIKEVARREEFDHPNSVVRFALSYFLVQYAEVNPSFKDYLEDIAMRALLGETAISGIELYPNSQDSAG